MDSSFGEPPKSVWGEDSNDGVPSTPDSRMFDSVSSSCLDQYFLDLGMKLIIKFFFEEVETSILGIETIEDWQIVLERQLEGPLLIVALVAQWYKPAMSFLGTFHDLSEQYPDTMFAIIDVDESKALIEHLGCLNQPGFLIYQAQKKATEVSGITAFTNTVELETILRYELESRGAKKIPKEKIIADKIMQQAMKLAKPNETLKLRPKSDSTDSPATVADASTSTPTSPYKSLPSFNYFPCRDYLVWSSTANVSVIEAKLLSFCTELIPDFSTPSPNTNVTEANIKSIMSVLSDELRYSSTNFQPGELEGLEQILSSWEPSMLFPALDVLRLAMLHPMARTYFLRTEVISNIVNQIPTAPYAHQFMAFKVIANTFESRMAKQLVLSLFENIISAIQSLATSANKNLQFAMATVLLNYTIFFNKEGISDDVYKPAPLLESTISLFKADQSEDSLFRLLVAIGTLYMQSPHVRAQLTSEQFESLLSKHLSTYSLSDHTKQVIDDIRKLFNIHQHKQLQT